MRGIPLPGFLKRRRLTLGSLGDRHFGLRHQLAFQCLTTIGFIDIFNQHPQRTAVADDVMEVQQEIVLLAVCQQTDAEQPVAHETERLHEARLLSLDVRTIDNRQLVLADFSFVDGLHGVAVIVQGDAGEECRVCFHRRFDSLCQPDTIQAAIERIAIRKVITGLAFVVHTLHIQAILGFR